MGHIPHCLSPELDMASYICLDLSPISLSFWVDLNKHLRPTWFLSFLCSPRSRPIHEIYWAFHQSVVFEDICCEKSPYPPVYKSRSKHDEITIRKRPNSDQKFQRPHFLVAKDGNSSRLRNGSLFLASVADIFSPPQKLAL